MLKQTSFHWEDMSSFYYDISTRNEYTSFACMFCLFTFLAFCITVFLSILAHNTYYHDSEVIQRRFIPYFVLGLISLILFFIFFLGSLVYMCKLMKKFRSIQTTIPPLPLPRTIENSNENLKEKPRTSFLLADDELSYPNIKALTLTEQKSNGTNITYQACQTDV
ncbi:unnamed protein product [Adineta steineri]|uniref:Uncharacterized protein n=1 Tax=Adineta steineri TaxID=433720 RepID=A0A818SG84_9BILA|nr:unnamed protein product [Adineta steineri]CAF3667027.1 unnamed protein product [Adineta steineri]